MSIEFTDFESVSWGMHDFFKSQLAFQQKRLPFTMLIISLGGNKAIGKHLQQSEAG
jgi:hypothetical protein